MPVISVDKSELGLPAVSAEKDKWPQIPNVNLQ